MSWDADEQGKEGGKERRIDAVLPYWTEATAGRVTQMQASDSLISYLEAD